MRLLASTVAGLGALAVLLAACAQERAPVESPAGAAAGVGSGASPGAGGDGGGTSTSAEAGGGGAPPLPEVDDCACLVATREPVCRTCVEEAATGSCTDEAAACDAAEPGYCAIVIDCLARCPAADAHCADACLGADDTARERVEAFAACACSACSGACGSGDC